MRKAAIFQQAVRAGILDELGGGRWGFRYEAGYAGRPVSLTMPVTSAAYEFDQFLPVFEGLLPEGEQLDAMLRRCKIDRKDFFRQLVVTGEDLVGSLTVPPRLHAKNDSTGTGSSTTPVSSIHSLRP